MEQGACVGRRLEALLSDHESLVPEDTDGKSDVYERSAGVTTLVTPGTALGAALDGLSSDGSRVLFETKELLDSVDSDGGWLDIYEASGGTFALISAGGNG